MANINVQNEYETATHSSSSSRSSYSASAPLRNVNIHPSIAGELEEQKQTIKHLQEQLAEFNREKYRSPSTNKGKGENVMRTSKKVSMTSTDQINQQTVGSFVREVIWPCNKMLPKKWSQWREEKDSLCQMILRKVAIPIGVDKKSYWESILLGITNNKFCALRANFKQELFEQYQGEIHFHYL